MPHVLAPQEEATIRAFIVRERRDRFLELLPNPKKRQKITSSLAHPNPAWFDARFVHCTNHDAQEPRGNDEEKRHR